MPHELSSSDQSYILLSDLANDLKIPAYRLRSWEVLYPFIKSFRDSSGRRFYDAKTVDIFKEISRLLYQEGRKSTEIVTIISHRLAQDLETSSHLSEEKAEEAQEKESSEKISEDSITLLDLKAEISSKINSLSEQKENFKNGLQALLDSLNKLGETIVSQEKI